MSDRRISAPKIMARLRQIFILLNIITVALIVVYVSNYTIDRMTPDQVCYYGKNRLSKSIHQLFGQTYHKYLIYLCDGPDICGEWTDRLEGIVMTYLLAKMTNRKFRLLSTSPIRLEKLMEPKFLDWKFIPKKVPHGSCAVYDFLSYPDFHTLLQTSNLEDAFQEDVIYIRLSKFSWKSLQSNPIYTQKVEFIANGTAQGFFKLINEILRLNKRMLYQFIVYKNQYKPKAGSHLVCAVVEGQDGPLSEGDREALWQFLDKYKSKNRTKIVVSSMDNKLLDIAIIRYTDRFMSMPGIISKFDSGEELRYRILDNLRQIILDFYTLLECETLVMSCGSKLGTLSAFTRYLDANVYYLKGGRVHRMTMDELGVDFENGHC